MKCLRSILHAMVIAAVYWAGGLAEAAEYQVGVAKVDITPGYPIRLNGFGNRREESEGITQRIWAKALAVQSGDDSPNILISIDSLGIRQPMVEEVARRLKDKAGIERNRIAVTFSHSHATPKVNGAADTIFSSPIPPEHQQHIDRYTIELTNAMEAAALKALANRQPSTLAWAVGKVAFAKNRRPQGGPVDHELPMLVVKSAADGAIRAIFVTYACHCVTLSDNKISGDWAGFAQEAIERNNPGIMGLVSIGCGSDANPDSGVTGGNTAAAADQGAQIADEVTRLLQGPLTPITGKIDSNLANIELPLRDSPTRAELEKLAATDNPAGYNAKFQLAILDRGESLLTKIDYPIQTWSFGDSLVMVFLGGEICADYSVRLKQEMDASRLWLHGYSNDFGCYIPSERLLKEGGYGGGAETVYFALPNTLQAGLEALIVNEVHRQVPERFKFSSDADRQTNIQRQKLKRSLDSIQVKKGFIVEVAAADPLVADPVAIDFGADGRMWVAEMPDYTRDVNEEFKQSGNVRVLNDRDGDGRFDEAVVFAEGLRFPTDVKAWRRGAIVCDAPDVIYFEDVDGDSIADRRTVLLTGFETKNPQARVNSLRWGLDNWLYGSGGLLGGNIKSHTGQELSLGNRDFRFRPDTGEIEGVTGRTQQGRARNDWGDWFGCENGSLMEHYPLVDRYMARNPQVAPPPTDVFVPVGPDPNQLHPIGTPSIFALSGPPGRPTSACGLEIYRDDLLGPEFANNAFVAEPVNNLVHRRILSARGSSFQGERAADEQDVEFLASTELRFRPVQIRTGLDGYLYVVDMHRELIEHPQWVPPQSLEAVDVMGGRDEGRIYRIRPRAAAPRTTPRFDQLTAEELVAILESPNGPQRDLAQQLLVDRRAGDVAPLLRQLVVASTRPATRLQALCTLEGIGVIDAKIVGEALSDPDPAVRRHAIRISESLVRDSPELAAAVIKLTADGDPQVRMQLAYTLGEVHVAEAAGALAELAAQGHSDPYLMSAIWSSVSPRNAAAVVRRIVSHATTTPVDEGVIETAVKLLVVQGNAADIHALADKLSEGDDAPPWKMGAVATLLENFRGDAADSSTFEKQFDPVMSKATEVLEDAAATEGAKLSALRVIAACQASRASLAPLFARLLGPQHPPAIRQSAVEELASIGSPEAAETILASWRGFTAELRRVAFDAVLGDVNFTRLLMEKVATGDIEPNDLDALQRQRLLDHADMSIRAQAEAAFAGGKSDRQELVARYAREATTAGDAEHGRELFARHCSSCHQLQGEGYAVGPDLAALSSREPTALLQSILDPNKDIDDRYRSYTALTIDGLSHAGILAGETSTSVTLLEQQGKRHTLLRADLELFESSGKSLMPEGLERDISAADAADLIAYLAVTGPAPKKVDGNQPSVVKPDDGTLWLMASSAEIYGDDITFEQPFQNIGYWHGQNDHVAWQVEHPTGGEFEVILHWACADDAAGNRFAIDGLKPPIANHVGTTGGYDRFHTVHLGQSSLPPGKSRVVVRPAGPLTTHHLMDLRGVYLVPRGMNLERALAGEAPTEEPDAAVRVAKLLEGLAIGTPEEYDRIPAIWEEAIAAGRRNSSRELVRLLDLSLPKEGELLRDWQAVVIGGGVINGLSAQGAWPRDRIAELLKHHQPLRERWERTIDLSAAMAVNEAVKHGTRYDALRILGADTWERGGAKLEAFLHRDVNAELQMGAVSGLGDIDSPRAADALLAAIPHLHEKNRRLAIEGMLRTPDRRRMVADALASGALGRDLLTDEEQSKFVDEK